MACGVNNIRIEPINVSWGGSDLGLLDGDVEFTTDEKSVDITAHQSGPTVLDTIRTGNSVEVKLNLKETDATRLQQIFKAGGATSTAQAEISTITCVADVASSLQNKYFFINTALDAIKHYVWINVATLGTDPAPSGFVGVPVAISANASASTVASAVQAALDALPGYVATVSGAVVTVTNASTGHATDAADFNAGFTIAVTQQGCDAGLIGWGSSKDFKSMLGDAQKLILKPVGSGSTDFSRDLAIWKAYPKIESLNFSGENPEVASISFMCFRDCTRQDSVNLFIYGGDYR